MAISGALGVPSGDSGRYAAPARDDQVSRIMRIMISTSVPRPIPMRMAVSFLSVLNPRIRAVRTLSVNAFNVPVATNVLNCRIPQLQRYNLRTAAAMRLQGHSGQGGQGGGTRTNHFMRIRSLVRINITAGDPNPPPRLRRSASIAPDSINDRGLGSRTCLSSKCFLCSSAVAGCF